MKKIITFLAMGIMILAVLASCGTQKKVAQPAAQNKNTSDLLPWTAKLQDTVKFSTADLQAIDFYSSTAILMSGKFFSKSAAVEGGVVVIYDTTGVYSKTFDKNTKGKIVGVPQRDPGSTVIKSFSVLFEKGDVSYTFQFDLSGNIYLLNSAAEITYEGKKHKITTYNEETNQGERCILLFSLKRRSFKSDNGKVTEL